MKATTKSTGTRGSAEKGTASKATSKSSSGEAAAKKTAADGTAKAKSDAAAGIRALFEDSLKDIYWAEKTFMRPIRAKSSCKDLKTYWACRQGRLLKSTSKTD